LPAKEEEVVWPTQIQLGIIGTSALDTKHVRPFDLPDAESKLDQDGRMRSKVPHKCQELNFWTKLPKSMQDI
jgi:hypothetical protein